MRSEVNDTTRLPPPLAAVHGEERERVGREREKRRRRGEERERRETARGGREKRSTARASGLRNFFAGFRF